MTTLDITALINSLVSGFIGFIFGILGAWVTYRLERKRDDITWIREKDKLEKQFNHEKELLELEFEKKLLEMNVTASDQRRKEIRQKLLQGIENPAEAIKAYSAAYSVIESDKDYKQAFIQAEREMEEALISGYSWWSLTPKKAKTLFQAAWIVCSFLLLSVILLVIYFLR